MEQVHALPAEHFSGLHIAIGKSHQRTLLERIVHGRRRPYRCEDCVCEFVDRFQTIESAITTRLESTKWHLRLIVYGRHIDVAIAGIELIRNGSPATNILADRLKKLELEAIIEKYPSTRVAGKNAYRLTDKGLSLYPVLGAVAAWGLANINGTRSFIAATFFS